MPTVPGLDAVRHSIRSGGSTIEVPLQRRSLSGALSLLAVARLIVNTGHRLVSPFLPVIARGLGIPLESAGVLVAARSAASMATPGIVMLGRKLDRKALAQIGLGIFMAGSAVTAVFGVYAGVLVGFLLMGLGKSVFDVSGQAYLSDRVPYEKRARSLAIFEMTWAGGFLVGAPFVGWIIAQAGWEMAYAALAGLIAVAIVVSIRLLDSDHPNMTERGKLSLSRSAWAMLAVALLFSAGGEVTVVVLGAWLEEAFSIALVGIAGLASLIGLAELSGSVSTAVFTDRLGKRRAVTIGLIINIVGYTLMAISGDSIVIGIAGALIAFAGFEFLIVSAFPLASELVPAGRARYLAWMVVAIGLGRGLAGLAGPVLFTRSGFGSNAVSAIGLDLVALAVLRAAVTEPDRVADVSPT